MDPDEIPVQAVIQQLQQQIAQLALDLALTRARLDIALHSESAAPTPEENAP